MSGDQAALRLLVERYFSAVDRRDWATLRTCFADDARMLFGWDVATGVAAEEVVGGDRIVVAIRRVEHFATSVHALAHTWIEVDGDVAVLDTAATAVLEDRRDRSEPVLRVRGLRYRDEAIRVAGGWVLGTRRHSALWELARPPSPLTPLPPIEP
jgi:hypothetical protein